MPKEIERKFLAKPGFKEFAISRLEIIQAYLSNDPQRTVRVRIVNNKAFITIKGISNNSGLTRFEWEKEILKDEAKELIELKKGELIQKTRYIIPASNNLNFEVDEFHGDNKGLNIAEIELPSEDSVFKIPDWLGKEVTGDKKYYNSYLSQTAYKDW
jgi:adenylate cyclase